MKTFLKLLTTIVGITVTILFQGLIRDLFSIDPRIWFFVQYIGGVFLLMLVYFALYNEIQIVVSFLKDWKNNSKLLKEKLKNNKTLKIIYKIINLTFWIPTTAIIFFNIIYPDVYENHIWMKLISLIFYCISNVLVYFEYRNLKKRIDFVSLICLSFMCIVTFFELLCSI